MPPAKNPTCVDMRNRLTNCADEEDILHALNDLTPHVGKVARRGGYCYTVGGKEQPDGDCVSVSEPFYDDCEDCQQCYRIQNCNDEEEIVYVDNDLSGHIGEVIRYNGTCWIILDRAPTEEQCAAISTSTFYEDCEECQQCYSLQNCDDEGDILYVDNDLSGHVGEIIHYYGKCWIVLDKSPTEEPCRRFRYPTTMRSARSASATS